LTNRETSLRLRLLKERSGIVWVKGKIDAENFGNKMLKYDRDGEKEFALSEMTVHLSME
jgi:hypothetical protein